MQFTSTAREDVNRPGTETVDGFDTVRPEDPKPWVSSNGYRHEVQAWHPISGSDFYDPRPGYRAASNPILVTLRKVANRNGTRVHEYLPSLEPGMSWQWESVGTPEHVEHARKVLTRLAGLEPRR